MIRRAAHELSARVAAPAAAPHRRLAAAAPVARLVLNHSTHADDLIATLRGARGALGAAGVTTVVPGRVTRTAGGRAETLSLTVTVALPHGGGFKALARRGATLQEVFFTCPALSAEALQALLNDVLARAK
jgi:hypothetical protein